MPQEVYLCPKEETKRGLPISSSHFHGGEERFFDLEIFNQGAVVTIHDTSILFLFVEILKDFLDTVHTVQDGLKVYFDMININGS